MSKNTSNPDWEQILEPLKHCSLCPRECHVDRTAGKLGFCCAGALFAVSSVLAHKGEEPPISGEGGICNVFFPHCNMHCIYCQNYQISDNRTSLSDKTSNPDQIVQKIEAILDGGVSAVGFVSPSHFIPQMKVLINILKSKKRDLVFVLNTNAYDKKETIQGLEEIIQVYLPDLKYLDDRLAMTYSDTPNYAQVATTAIKEMFRQKGADLLLDDKGNIRSGLIIRHLVLPGEIENTKKALRFIASELSPSVWVSLMAQYCPNSNVKNHPHLGRRLRKEEYEEVLEEFQRLGFHRGWSQNIDSSDCYRPDFSRQDPFNDN